MIGLYFFGVIALWGWVTWLLMRFFWRVMKRSGKKLTTGNVLVSLVLMVWLGVSFWEVGGKKVYWDAKVNRLCAIDGGVKVYVTVKLPAERFDKYGNIGIKNKIQAKLSDEYYFESEDIYLRENNPKIIRSTTRVIRSSDEVILGESIRYGRGGGDIPGPWHPSSYDCPQIKNAEGKLESSIFVKGVK